MPMEVTCGQCHQPLLVEATGVVVACPHCGAHLEIPDEEPATAGAVLSEAAAVSESGPSSITDAIAALGAPPVAPGDANGQTALEDPSSHVYESPAEPWTGEDLKASSVESENSAPLGDSFPKLPVPVEVADQTATAAIGAAEDNPFAFLTTSDAPAPEPARGPFDLGGFEPAPAVSEPVFPVVVDAPLPEPEREAVSAEKREAAPASVAPAFPAGDFVPRKQFLMVASYASAVTLILIYVLFLRPVRTHQLESLPDLKPPVDSSGEIGMKVAPPDADVAPGHVLRLGESRRFGNVRVTPLRVTRASLAFRHFDQSSKSKREPSAPVLKLWLKLENASSDQTFAPLDRLVVYKRGFADSGVIVKTNAFLGSETERRKGREGQLHYLYPLPEESEWLIVGQVIDDDLAPGATLETFLPSEENVDLTGDDLVWRFQFRKGYHPRSHRGVLTLVDVRFRADQIEDEAVPRA